MQQLRLTFTKTGPARYIGHLDLHRAWERILRRAGAPVAYSEGFHPQARLQFASALPLGYSSDAEIMDVFLEHEIDLTTLRAELDRATPPGIAVRAIANIPLDPTGKKNPALPTLLRSAHYTLTLADPCPDLPARVARILTAPALPTDGKRTSYDFRPRLEALAVDPAAPTRILHAQLAAAEQTIGRPADLLTHLNLDPTAVTVHRTALILADP